MKFKDLATIADLTLKQSAKDVDIELFNAKLVELFPDSKGYRIKRFYPEGEFVFNIHGESTWQIRVQMEQSADESSIEFDISILPSNVLARFFRNVRK